MTGVQTCALPICFPVTISTVGKHLATRKKFKTKEEAETYYRDWDTTFALIAEMIELNENAKNTEENEPKEQPNKTAE